MPRRSANITNIANIRQYSPILISNNIDQSDWPILILKPLLSLRDLHGFFNKSLNTGTCLPYSLNYQNVRSLSAEIKTLGPELNDNVAPVDSMPGTWRAESDVFMPCKLCPGILALLRSHY